MIGPIQRALRSHPWFFIFVLGLTVRMVPVIVQQRYKDIQAPEMVEIGKTLAATGNFANPFPVPTGKTAICPPAYPFLLSLIFRALGVTAVAELAIQLLASAAAALQFALLPWLAAASGFQRSVGIAAGYFGAAIPFWFWIETKGSYDTAYTSLLVVALLAVFAQNTIASNAGLPLWYGLAWGLTLLFNPTFLTVLAPLCALRIWRARDVSRKAALRDVVLTVTLAILVLVPWTVRNYLEFGSLFLIRDNYGLELSVSNGPESSPLFDENTRPGGPYATHPFHNDSEARRLSVLGEPRYFEEKKAAAFAWIRQNPAQFAHLTALRILYFWFPLLNAPLKTLFCAAITIFGIAGFVISFLKNRAGFYLLATVLIVYPLSYYIMQVDVRYRYPLYCPLLLCAAYCLSIWAGAVMTPRQKTASNPDRAPQIK